MTQRRPNPVQGRVILEVTSHHAVLYLCDRRGVVTDNEIFRYSLSMTKSECEAECRGLFGMLYDALNDMVNGELQGDAGESPESG